jgi:hypothetical protein
MVHTAEQQGSSQHRHPLYDHSWQHLVPVNPGPLHKHAATSNSSWQQMPEMLVLVFQRS